jgi:zinc/manganese transport system substrate-binding protein
VRAAAVRSAAAATGVAVLAALTGCGSGAAAADDGSGRVAVVASTDVWGDVAAAVGGSRVQVTSVISGTAADPHAYEATPRAQLAVSRAAVVVENGGGYDDFMGRLLSASGSRAAVVDAVAVSGRAAQARAAGTELNEHVWYDLPSVRAVADRLAGVLAAADPAGAAAFRAGAAAFGARLDALAAREQAGRARVQGAGVVVTEPVPGYVLQARGAVDRTPPAFAHAVEDGDDVAPAVLRQTEDLLAGGAVRALVYNEQAVDAQTTVVRAAAARAHLPVVPVTETLPPRTAPPGEGYLAWMGATIDALTRALAP